MSLCFGGPIGAYYGENRPENTLPYFWFSIFNFFVPTEILQTVGMRLILNWSFCFNPQVSSEYLETQTIVKDIKENSMKEKKCNWNVLAMMLSIWLSFISEACLNQLFPATLILNCKLLLVILFPFFELRFTHYRKYRLKWRKQARRTTKNIRSISCRKSCFPQIVN